MKILLFSIAIVFAGFSVRSQDSYQEFTTHKNGLIYSDNAMNSLPNSQR